MVAFRALDHFKPGSGRIARLEDSGVEHTVEKGIRAAKNKYHDNT
jgi:hypothetical protein